MSPSLPRRLFSERICISIYIYIFAAKRGKLATSLEQAVTSSLSIGASTGSTSNASNDRARLARLFRVSRQFAARDRGRDENVKDARGRFRGLRHCAR